MNITAICWAAIIVLGAVAFYTYLHETAGTDEWDALRGESDTDGC